MESTAAGLGSGVPGADDADYTAALDRWLASGAPDLDDRTASVLGDLRLGVRGGDALMTSLSGGQAARVGLAALLLLSRFDVVLLDEPTNDLDLDGLERLEAASSTGMRGRHRGWASHDREFLARCVTRVVELDLAQQQVQASTTAATTGCSRSGPSPGGTPARPTSSSPGRAPTSCSGPAPSASGARRACATR